MGRRFGAWLLSSVLAILLFTLAIDTGFLRVIGHPATIKSILDKSNIYNSVVPGLLDQAKTIKSDQGSVPLSDPIVRSAATSTITPQYLRTNVNQAIDSIYSWLDKKTAQPNFNFNLTDLRSTFADKVSAGAKQRAAGLPVCSTAPTTTTIDAFSATCLPRGVTPDMVANQVRSSILSGQGFLDSTNIQANDLKANGSNKSVFSDQLKNAPDRYQDFKASPIVLGILCLLLATGVTFTYRPWARGLRHVGYVFASTGVIVVLLALGIKAAVSNKVVSNLDVNNAVLQKSLRTLVVDVAHTLTNTYVVIGIVYISLGVILYLVTHYLGVPQPGPVVADKPVQESPNPAAASKKPTKKVKVQ